MTEKYHWTQALSLDVIPLDGTYNGIWGGYVATAVIDGKTHRFRTALGIRTPRAEAEIIIRHGEVRVRVSQK